MTNDETKAQLSQTEIAKRAYELWEKAGRHHGRDLEFWLLAEAKLRARQVEAAQPAAPVNRPSTRRKGKRAVTPAGALPPFRRHVALGHNGGSR